MSFQSSPTTGIAIVSTDHTFAWVNQDFAEIVGYRPEQLTGRSFESITYAEDLNLDSHLADRLFRGEMDKYEMEKRYVHTDGSIVPIHLTVTLIRDRFDAILYALSTVYEIAGQTLASVPAEVPLTAEERELDRIRRAVLG